MNITMLIIIGISLSMDTFSLALSLGTFNINKKYYLLFPLTVGIFHFFMPIFGYITGSILEKYITFNENTLLGLIFLFIFIEMFIDIFSKEEKEYNLNIINIFIYAFSVSVDSFSLGIGIKNITTSVVMASTIFLLLSSLFTYIGLKIGKYSYNKLGKLSKIIGTIIIFLMSILHFIK